MAVTAVAVIIVLTCVALLAATQPKATTHAHKAGKAVATSTAPHHGAPAKAHASAKQAGSCSAHEGGSCAMGKGGGCGAHEGGSCAGEKGSCSTHKGAARTKAGAAKAKTAHAKPAAKSSAARKPAHQHPA